MAGRVRAATGAGAAAVIVYSWDDEKIRGGTLRVPDPDGFVSCGTINRDVGLALKERLDEGEEVEAYFQQTQIFESRTTQNVIAETKGGDPNNVIMVCDSSTYFFTFF